MKRLTNAAGLAIGMLSNGAVGRIEFGGVNVNLFPGNAVEGGPAQLWLRCRGDDGKVALVPLLGPSSPLHVRPDAAGHEAAGRSHEIEIHLQLRLAESEAAWFWHLQLANRGTQAWSVDLIAVQDIGLAPYAAIRNNEHYVSQYIDLAPLVHAQHGAVVAARQNQAVDGRNPWLLMGSLRRGVSYATDGLQVDGLALRAGEPPSGIVAGLPGTRLQHEHALIAIQDAPVQLDAGAVVELGVFARCIADHREASGYADLACVDATLALPEAVPGWPALPTATAALAPAAPRSLFTSAPLLATRDLDEAALATHFSRDRRFEERDADGQLLSFFHGSATHVALRAKELRVQRPHGHMLRSGRHLLPDETALTSTVWMAGVFHSMLTQGHVSINRCLSTVRGWLGQYRSHGLRLFVDGGSGWQQLGVPSAFEIEADGCRWLYAHAGGVFEVRSRAVQSAHEMSLSLQVLAGPPLRLRATLHVALAGDDGSASPPLAVQRRGSAVRIAVPADSDLAARFPHGGFVIAAEIDSRLDRVGGDEMLFDDEGPHGEPYVCIDSGAVRRFGLRLIGELVDGPRAAVDDLPPLGWCTPAASPLARQSQGLAEMLPWWRHNALVHYLSPRGLEQYSGGGWGTRDVCQGPTEMLLALNRPQPVRDLLCRVFAAQNTDGDWPQWFMFFDRESVIRAGDSHGDIVFWPLVALARYLLASGDAALLDAVLPFHTAGDAEPVAEPVAKPVREHVQRALALITARRIPGTHLAAYGHGDWNDSLQPADPAMRERLCSAWTVTLNHQMLTLLAQALRLVGNADDAAQAGALRAEAAAVRADFQRLLVAGGCVTGYALFPDDASDVGSSASAASTAPQLLLHPRDDLTGLHYSLLPMMHAVIEDLLTPEQAHAQLALIETHLQGPDGARLFDRPLRYRGGPQTLFQRAESSAFFGREIGVMYMHAHLRYAEMLAHLGVADRFFDALCRSHPVALRERVPASSLRQANCYYSSSDAAFADRYAAQDDYGRIAAGTVALDGGWRIYSSGPGIATGLVAGAFLGLRLSHDALVVDPVMPAALDGLRTTLVVCGCEIDVEYRIAERGCGPQRLELDGVDLPFERVDNPYRVGGARVPLAALAPRLGSGSHSLRVHLA